MVGGISQEKPADDHVQQIVDQVSSQIKLKCGKDFSHLKAVSYKTQVVAGTNYFIKVDAGNEVIHLRVFQPLPCYSSKPELSSFKLSKSRSDPIEYF
ncbi:unnamed protein product [Brachionus calyciflorus]|uniref:Cystatin domain-containing protein n=1 Tax=Brachionus calyciflorus TaxID=104777 RepID=A0A813T001_9BILA|nr:unnamed protein product [Brachionus calyciflorus]